MREESWSTTIDGVLAEGSERGPARLVVRDGVLTEITPVPFAGTGVFAFPAFVNAHSHLDLTAIRGEALPRDNFAAWVQGLMGQRRALSPEGVDVAIGEGVAELLQTGTAAVGDIDSMGRSAAVLATSPLQGVVYREVVGRPDEAVWSQVEAAVEATEARPDLRVGLSPHAPYSTPEETYRRCAELARSREAPLATHVSESPAEEEFLDRGTGPLSDLFTNWGFPAPRWNLSGSGFRRAAAVFENLVGWTAIHANFTEAADAEEAHDRGIHFVHCPRSFRYFDYREHPVERWIAAGRKFALGTDSRASNHGLDLWAEMSELHRTCPRLKATTIVSAATEWGRELLGLAPASLRVGDEATLQLVSRARGAEPLLEAAVGGSLRTVATIIRGRIACGRTFAREPIV